MFVMSSLSVLVKLTIFFGAITCASGWLGTTATSSIIHYVPPEAVEASSTPLLYSFESGHASSHAGSVDVQGVQMASPTALFVIAIVAAYCGDLFFGENSTTISSSSMYSSSEDPTITLAVESTQTPSTQPWYGYASTVETSATIHA